MREHRQRTTHNHYSVALCCFCWFHVLLLLFYSCVVPFETTETVTRVGRVATKTAAKQRFNMILLCVFMMVSLWCEPLIHRQNQSEYLRRRWRRVSDVARERAKSVRGELLTEENKQQQTNCVFVLESIGGRNSRESVNKTIESLLALHTHRLHCIVHMQRESDMHGPNHRRRATRTVNTESATHCHDRRRIYNTV